MPVQILTNAMYQAMECHCINTSSSGSMPISQIINMIMLKLDVLSATIPMHA